MKLLSVFETLATLTSSGENASFPASNIKLLDPMLRWHADAYTGAVWLMVDFGAAKSLTGFFLNQANFPACVISGDDTPSPWSPAFTMNCSLLRDDLNNRKGFFSSSTFNYRYLRVTIAGSQSLDNSETVPSLGNLIVGASETLPFVTDLNPAIVTKKKSFDCPGGGYFEADIGRGRQVITMGLGDTWAKFRSMSKSWADAVVFADLGNVAESWLVFSPGNWEKPIKNIFDSKMSFQLRERT